MTIQEADKHFIHTYNRSVVFTKGEGMYLYDDQGKKYLDMGAGIAVSALGYSNEEFKQALKDQIDDLIHISNLYYTKPAIKAAELICNVSGMDRVFFTNSGAEAIEGAIKLASEGPSVPLKPDPVGRHQEDVFEKRDAPAEHDHQQLGQRVEPTLPPQMQLSVPCESHENIGDNEHPDCKIRFHYGSNQFLRDKITNYS